MCRATRALLVGLIVVVLTGCGNNPIPASPAAVATAAMTPSPQVSPQSAVGSSSPQLSASPSPDASPSPSPAGLTKAPFTVLILGGDDGFRTDAIIVVGIDPVKKTVAYASLPRDTIDVPMPGGGVYRQMKVNSFYNYAAARHAQFPQGPGRATADMIGLVMGIHIDYYAATTFSGFSHLVDAMGGIHITVPQAVVDPLYQVTNTKRGIRFEPGAQVMGGARALIYVRTRTGDSDFNRSRRQQVFLTAAGNQLLAHPEILAALIASRVYLLTDFPLDQILSLLNVIGSVPASSITSGIVFGPNSYSSVTSCSCGYALEPKLAAIRKTAALLFPWAVTR